METLVELPTRYRSIVILVFLLTFPVLGYSQSREGLTKLENYSIDVFFSQGHEAIAKEIAQLTQEAVAYFHAELAGSSPEVELLVISETDWPAHANMPVVYGMPHVRDKSLIVAAHDNIFWHELFAMLHKSHPIIGQTLAGWDN